MAVKGAKAGGNKKNVSMPAVIISVFLLVSFMAWWGYRSFGPEPVIKTEAAVSHDQWLDKIAKETGGDFSKVSAADVEKLQKETMGHGDLMLKAYAKDHGYLK